MTTSETHDPGVHYTVARDEADAPSRPDQSTGSSTFLGSLRSRLGLATRNSARAPFPTPVFTSSQPSTTRPLSTLTSVPISASRTRTFDPATERLIKQPTMSDMLIAYSTVPRYVSWRNSIQGSWFIQSVCDVFARHAATDDLCTLLTKVSLTSSIGHLESQLLQVNQRVAKLYESEGLDGARKLTESRSLDDDVSIVAGAKQAPEFSSCLQRNFYFYPGIGITAEV